MPNLRNMRQFYLTFPKRYALRSELNWTHYRILMRVESDDARDYYFNKCDIFHLTDFKVFEGDVFELADQACDFVMSHLSRRIGEHFHDAAETTYDRPERAVFEAIVNAIRHRDYNSNASVQVMLFPDHLEVSRPGPLPNGMAVAKLKRRHRSVPLPLSAQMVRYRWTPGLHLCQYVGNVGFVEGFLRSFLAQGAIVNG